MGTPAKGVPKVRRKISFRVKSCAVERILFSLSESEKEKREPASVGGAAPPRKITKEAWLLVKMRYLIEIIRPLPPSIRMTMVLYEDERGKYPLFPGFCMLLCTEAFSSSTINISNHHGYQTHRQLQQTPRPAGVFLPSVRSLHRNGDRKHIRTRFRRRTSLQLAPVRCGCPDQAGRICS